MPVLDRETFYKQVWTVPMTQLALKYGISDVGLAKVCRRYQVPRPPRGYWARVEAGQKPHRPPLPKTHDETLKRVQINGANMSQPSMNPADRDPRDRIIVGAALSNPHPMVEIARHQLAAVAANAKTMVKSDAQTAVDIRVRPETIDRALRIWDAFAKHGSAKAAR
jgi:hypothetical protein